MNLLLLICAISLLSWCAADQCPGGYHRADRDCPCYAGEFCLGTTGNTFCCSPGDKPDQPTTRRPAPTTRRPAPATTTTPPGDELTDADLEGLYDMNDNLQTLQTGLQSTAFGMVPYQSLASKVPKVLGKIAETFVHIVINRIKSKIISKKIKDTQRMIKEGFALVLKELKIIKEEIVAITLLNDYWDMRKKINEVEQAYEDFAEYTEDTDFQNRFIAKCKEEDLYSVLKDIRDFYVNGAAMGMAKSVDFNRTRYDRLIDIVTGDFTNGMQLEMACAGLQNLQNQTINVYKQRMSDWYSDVNKALQDGDNWITNNFQDEAARIASATLSSEFDNDHNHDPDVALSTTLNRLQTKFNWLQWAAVRAAMYIKHGKVKKYEQFWWDTYSNTAHGGFFLASGLAGIVYIDKQPGYNWQSRVSQWLDQNKCSRSSGMTNYVKCVLQGLNGQGWNDIFVYTVFAGPPGTTKVIAHSDLQNQMYLQLGGQPVCMNYQGHTIVCAMLQWE